METLSKLFGSVAKVKLMRLFLFNENETYGLIDVVDRSQVGSAEATRELVGLEKINLIKKKIYYKGVKRRKLNGWSLDASFPYLSELRHLLISTVLLKNEEIVKRLGSVGKVKLLIISGVFIQNEDSRVDLLVVGDALRKNTLLAVIKSMESEIGKELRYAALETNDFEYRMGLYDKLIRDIIDYPHTVIINKLGITTLQSFARQSTRS